MKYSHLSHTRRPSLLAGLFLAITGSAHAQHVPGIPETCRSGAAPALCAAQMVYDAFRYLDEGYERFRDVGAVMRAIERGEEPPNRAPDDWRDLAALFRDAARAAASAPAVTRVDVNRYRVDLDALRGCRTRTGAVARLEAFAAELERARERGLALRTDVVRRQDVADQSDRLLRELSALDAKLASVPYYGQVFAWDWFAITNTVRPALGQLRRALRTQIEVIDHELEVAGRSLSNLTGNLRQIDSSPCSVDLSGVWRLGFEQEDQVEPLPEEAREMVPSLQVIHSARGEAVLRIRSDAGTFSGVGDGRYTDRARPVNPSPALPARFRDAVTTHGTNLRIHSGTVNGSRISWREEKVLVGASASETYCHRWGNCVCEFSGTFDGDVARGGFVCRLPGGVARGTWRLERA